MILQLALGFILAGVIVTWLPALGLEKLVGDSPLLYLAMLVIKFEDPSHDWCTGLTRLRG